MPEVPPGFEESIEGLCAEHVDLVDDEDAVTAHLRRNIDLLCDLADVVDRIVGSRVEFYKVERIAHLDGLAGRALSAGFTLCVGREAVDGLAKMRAQDVLPTPRGPQNRYA